MLFVVLFMLAIAAAAASFEIAVTPGGVFQCANLNSAPLSDPANFEIVRAALAASPLTAEVYAQANGPRPAVAELLLQIASPFDEPFDVNSPLQEWLCGQTIEEAAANLWRAGALIGAQDVVSCSKGERRELGPNGEPGECVSTGPGTTANACAQANFMIYLILLVFVPTIVVVAFMAGRLSARPAQSRRPSLPS